MQGFAALVAACLERPDLDAPTEEALRLLGGASDPFGRTSPLHVTGSALVVHRASKRVLLRFHPQIGSWIQLGGHADHGEIDPFSVARREAAEESGLQDLRWTGEPVPPRIAQVVVVSVPPPGAHRHVDFRYLLFTETPERAEAEHSGAPLRWVSVDQALFEVQEENLLPLIGEAALAC